MPTPKSLKNGRYTLQESIPGGGMGEVYRGQDREIINRPIVVKLVRIAKNTLDNNNVQQNALGKFKSEVGALAEAQHRHVVAIFDYGEEKQRKYVLPYMVMPYCKEGSLQDWLMKYRADKPLEMTEVAELLEQAGEALNHLHVKGIVHRDIKSTNFLVENRLSDPSALPNLLLADFGLAQVVEEDTIQDSRGTDFYKPPEQWKREPLTSKTDQYQLAIMAYYLLTRKHPFEPDRNLHKDQQRSQLRDKHLHDRPVPPSTHRPNIPPEVDEVILRALAKQPRDRYETVKDFTNAFRDAITPRRRVTVPFPPPRPFLSQRVFNAIKTGSPGWIHPLAIFAPLLAILLIIASVLILFSSDPSLSTNCTSNITLNPHPQSGSSASNLNPFVNAPGIKESRIDACGNVIGLSAGTTIFDTTSPDNDEMQKGATALRNGDPSGASSHFQTVTTTDPSNAEAWIYAEDLRVLNHNLDYIAVVLGRDITSGRIGSSRDSLQGAYLAQIAYNQSVSQQKLPSLVVIIANSGANPANATWVAQQILELKKANSHVVGVVGWSNSPTSGNANAVLARQPKEKEKENVFMLAPSSSSKNLSGAHDFLRIIPSDVEQTDYLAEYAYNKLNYRNMAIIYTPDIIFSVDSFSSFKAAFEKKPGTVVSGQPYSQRDEASLRTALSKALQSHPDGIYFPGFAADAGLLLSLPQIANLPPQFKILGGSAMASVGDYPAGQPNLDRLVLISYASQDEWQVLNTGKVSQVSSFVNKFHSTFKVNTPGPGAIVTYDAVQVFLEGYQRAVANGGTDTCLSCALQKAFYSMNGAQAWQGVSGQIAFTGDSTEPLDKVLLINVFRNGALKTIDYRGCFLVDRTDCKS